MYMKLNGMGENRMEDRALIIVFMFTICYLKTKKLNHYFGVFFNQLLSSLLFKVNVNIIFSTTNCVNLPVPEEGLYYHHYHYHYHYHY